MNITGVERSYIHLDYNPRDKQGISRSEANCIMPETQRLSFIQSLT